MMLRRKHSMDSSDHALFDPALLAPGATPADFPHRPRRAVFLWQTPSTRTLADLHSSLPGAPILVGRFAVESAVRAAGLPYWVVTDFFPWRALIDIAVATQDACARWSGPPMPDYQRMPLVDGDYQRYAVHSELVACAAMLLVLRRANPKIEIVSDWFGATLARAVGLPVRSLTRANLGDPNWPPRRRWHETVAALRRSTRETFESGPQAEPPARACDVVFLLGNWTEERMLAGFPVEEMARRGARCSLWVTRHTAALAQLADITGADVESFAYPPPRADAHARLLSSRVRRWCELAARQGHFAPLRGRLADTVIRLLNWPRWTPKLLAMHRLMDQRFRSAQPRLMLSLAEKDWPAYCGHHAARSLGIPTVGIKHALWLPGGEPGRYLNGCLYPPAAPLLAAFTPGDAEAAAHLPGSPPGTVRWLGNPRLDHPLRSPDTSVPGRRPRFLIACGGVGPGFGMGLSKRIIPHNARLIERLHGLPGAELDVRLHPWDAPSNYPQSLRGFMRTEYGPIQEVIHSYDAVITTYSMFALDAAAAGVAVFQWDHHDLGLDRSELARHGAAIARVDLEELCAEIDRFVHDEACRRRLMAGARNYRDHLRQHLPPGSGMAAGFVDGLCALTGLSFTPAADATLADRRPERPPREQIVMR